MLFSVATSYASKPQVVWVVESETYAADVAKATAGYSITWCGANGMRCSTSLPAERAAVKAVVGRADALNLSSLPALALVQSASWYPVDPAAVPKQAAITNFDIWPTPWFQNYSVSNIGESVTAMIFDDVYRLAARSAAFLGCAFDASSPSHCDAASTAANHTTVSALTVGVLGYGRIGQQVAMRMAALGATVIATKHSPPFAPTPPGLKWLSSDNDRLLREADVVVVSAPGSVHGIINATSMGLMKEHALLIPISSGSVDFDAVEAALTKRPNLRAYLDVWPSGCWGDDDAKCGPPYGRNDWPGSPTLAALPNVRALPGLAMRDARFWAASAVSAGANLEALATGKPLKHIVRNASA